MEAQKEAIFKKDFKSQKNRKRYLRLVALENGCIVISSKQLFLTTHLCIIPCFQQVQ